jgi:hypothetical protein
MSRFKQVLVNLFVLGAIIVGVNVFASEFDPETGKLLAPELLIVREDAQGQRTLLTLDKAPLELKSEAEMQDLIAEAETKGNGGSASEGGAEGSHPSEFDVSTSTPAWYYWYYPNSYNCWYSYGYYSYYPRYTYTWGYYRYWYYYRW